MTPRSAAERGPGTVTATREQMIETWLRLYGGTDTDVASDVGGLFDALAGATAAVPLDAREALRHQLRTFTDHTNGSIHVDEPGDVDAFLDAILQTGGWKPAAVPLDVERLARALEASTNELAFPISHEFWLKQAAALAAEYASASADEGLDVVAITHPSWEDE